MTEIDICKKIFVESVPFTDVWSVDVRQHPGNSRMKDFHDICSLLDFMIFIASLKGHTGQSVLRTSAVARPSALSK
jgi:hypothetical protein